MTQPPQDDGQSNSPSTDRQSLAVPPVVADLDAESSPGQTELGSGSLIGMLTYGLSLPERTARTASAIVGGLVNESAARLIPASFRSSRSYSTFVQQALDMMVHDIGGVHRSDALPESGDEQASQAAMSQETLLARKTVGGLLDVAGAATLHLSPMTVLAVFNDLAYGSSHYLKLLSEELKREGIIDQESSIDRVSDLVDALGKTSGTAAEAFDTPPISLEGLNSTISQLTSELATVDPRNLIPQSEITRMWQEMEGAATKADVGLWDISTTMTMFAMNRITLTSRGALSTINVAGNLFDQHIVQHYSDALTEIGTNGLYETLSVASAPYFEAVWHNFDDGRETWTEDLINGKLIGQAWTSVRGWWS
ncbi:MAG: hypothetical protein AAGA03_09230 [Planctomycetota bacterium]